MIDTSDAYKTAIIQEARRTRLRVPLRIASPDLSYEGVISTGEAEVSHPEELHDDETTQGKAYAALETNFWVLDGSAAILPEDLDPGYEVGFVGDQISGEDGSFSTAQSVTLEISGVNLLQALSIYFPQAEVCGVPADFTVEVLQGGTAYFTRSFTDNQAAVIALQGFEVYVPDGIRVTVTRWSLPGRRVRVMEIFPGYRADWTEHNVSGLNIRMQASVNAMTMPYGTAALTIDNTERLFDPRNKEGLFKSLEERQAVPVEIGVDTEDGTEYIPAGVYYLHDRSWKTSDGGMTIRWDLVDIIGLLSTRAFVAPDTLPTTLAGWVGAIVAQLGTIFESQYTVDPDYAENAVTAQKTAVDGKACGDVLRWVCQVTGTFARADAETGYLAVEPSWSQGAEYTLENLENVPTISANDNLASIIFKINGNSLVVSGNTVNSANTVTVDNPFITTNEQALLAAQHILVTYGGNKVTTVGRGDPSSEIGDVVTVELDDGQVMTARVVSQSFDFSDGVLSGCKSEMVQADGTTLYENRLEFTEDGSWTAPEGVTELQIIVVGGGQSGGKGAWGSMPTAWPTGSGGTYYGKTGDRGKAGDGGKVWYGTVPINPGQTFQIVIGKGGEAADSLTPTDGTASSFGPYTSAAGRVYSPSFTDLASGNAYARTGVSKPQTNAGDGGQGGAGGHGGSETWEQTSEHTWRQVAQTSPGEGKIGVSGSDGCVIIYWSKEES